MDINETLVERSIRASFPWRRLLLGTMGSLVLLWFLFHLAPWKAVWQALRAVDARFLAVALLAVIVSPVVRAYRWRLLLFPRHQDLTYLSLLRALLIGQMLNTMVPAKAGELVRIQVLARRQYRNRIRILGSIVLEKWLDMMFQLALSVVALLIIPAPPWFRDARATLGLASLLFLLTAFFALRYRVAVSTWSEHIIQRFPEAWHNRLRRAVASALASLHVLRYTGIGLQLLILSLISLSLSVAVNTTVMLALGIRLPVAVSAFLLVALSLGITIPSAPTNLGIFHLICVLTLGLFGVASELALSYAVLLHVTVFLPPIVLGGVSMLWELIRPADMVSIS
ncbi:MAG: UPF0104 family protein [Chloroflexi bacterium]|nr:MAG: UPF0104 family protein [Chloroflexota bacterium]